MFNFRSLFYTDIAIDLGTANTLIYVKDKGVALNEPSVVAVQNLGLTSKVLAVGNDAKKMLGKTAGNINAVRPLRDGVIADFEAAEHMIKYFIKKVYINTYIKRSFILVCVPSGSTPVERKAIQDSAYNAGGNTVYLVEEPIAAAMGANLPIMYPLGSMIVDIGGGTTEVAVMSLGGIVYSKSLKVGGDKMDESIIAYIKKNFGITIGESSAQRIKELVGCAIVLKQNNDNSVLVRGLDIISGKPKEVHLVEEHLVEALEGSLASIIESCRECLERTPPELVNDILERGLVLAGGGALLKNFDSLISSSLGVPVIIAPDPLLCVANGTGKMLENLSKFKSLLTYY